MGYVHHRAGPTGAHVGRQLKLTLTAQQSQALTMLCRRYGILDDRGAARGVELVRVLLVTGLTSTATARSTAIVAARINAKMMVASMGSRLSRSLGATTVSGPTPIAVPAHIRLSLDTWLQNQLDRFAPGFRDGHGNVVGIKLIMGALGQGLSDRRLDEVLRYYAPMINPFRSKVVEYQTDIERSLSALARQWAASAAA